MTMLWYRSSMKTLRSFVAFGETMFPAEEPGIDLKYSAVLSAEKAGA